MAIPTDLGGSWWQSMAGVREGDTRRWNRWMHCRTGPGTWDDISNCADAGDGEACNLGALGLLELWGIKGLYSLDTNIVGNQMKMSVWFCVWDMGCRTRWRCGPACPPALIKRVSIISGHPKQSQAILYPELNNTWVHNFCSSLHPRK